MVIPDLKFLCSKLLRFIAALRLSMPFQQKDVIKLKDVPVDGHCVSA